jgi:hypothetical protein
VKHNAHAAASTPAGANFRLGSPPLYYDIRATAQFSGPVQVCVTYDEAAFSHTQKLRLTYSSGGKWVTLPNQVVDTASRTVCAETTSL